MRRPLCFITAAALAATAAHAAHAATGTFNGTLDAGPLAGAAFTGSYRYDDAAITGATFEQVVLSAFSLHLASDDFALNPSATADFSAGVFLGFSYADSRPAYTLTLTSGSLDASDAFLHVVPTSGLESSGGYSVTPSAVPEPGPMNLLIGGLCSLALVIRRRQS